MKNKHKIIHGQEARSAILGGMRIADKVVSSTLGPRSANVAIDKGYETIVIHDGVKVLENVKTSDKYKKIGIDIILQAAKKQVQECGDGTTLCVILAYSIAREANKIVAAGTNSMSLRNGLEKLRDEVIEKINKLSIPVKTLEQMMQVATVSSANKDIGKLIGETIHDIGADGISTVEESHSRDTTVDMQEGLQIENGWRLPHFITSDDEDETAVLEGARVLVTDMVLSDFQELQPFIVNELIPHGKTLFVIAQDFEGNVLPSFVMNKMNGKMNVLCVQAPLFENIQKDLLNDIAILTGATMVSEDTGLKIKDLKYEHLGYADKIKSTKDATIITGGKGDKKQIATRIKSLKKQMEDVEGFDASKLQERLAKLTGKVAVIKVGGATEIEMRERKERVEDAVEATKTAVRDGIVAGGEIPLLNIAKTIKDKDSPSTIMRNALESPFERLLGNAGLDAGEYKEKLKEKYREIGVDVTTGELVNMIEKGIIDPTGVLTSAVYNSVSVAIQAFTSESVIPFEEEEKK